MEKIDINKNPEYWKAVWRRILSRIEQDPELNFSILAQKSGITSSVFTHMKNGKAVRVTTIQRIAKVLQVEAAILLGGEIQDDEYYDFILDASQLAKNKKSSQYFKSIKASMKQAIKEIKNQS